MNQFSKLSILVISLILFSSIGKAQNIKQENQDQQNMIKVFDFHSTNRCTNCKAIEANTKYTLETFFEDEMKNGKITFQIVNIDKEENYEIAKKFKASGTSLFLNIINLEKEKQIDLTGFAFSYVRHQDIFSKKLKAKLEKQLAKLL